ncbi:MAG: DUF1385 domain-containing protein [Acidobacteriaceae bacterium]|nr:DUF1385 domain-containing protein [Acidobacteriaceae bacterium]
MEGVMMRSPQSYCVAVRRPDGEIVTEEHPLQKVSERYPVFKLPVLRGLGTLGQAMWLGMRALRFSASCAMDEGTGPRKDLGSTGMAINLAGSLLFFIALYKFVPLYLATLLGRLIPALGTRLAINIVDGVIRIAIFLAFLFLISRLKDIHRVFQYHGAEHRVVFNFESGRPVTIENAQEFVTWHPRCGTSFLLVVMVISMIFYAFLPFDGFALKFVSRIALLPVITGVSYELIRYAAKKQRGLMALLTRPGLWLQRVTTQSPSNDQTEVAICALERAMELERAQGGELVIA